MRKETRLKKATPASSSGRTEGECAGTECAGTRRGRQEATASVRAHWRIPTTYSL